MQTINIELNKNQFLKSIRKLDEKDKLEIYEELKKSLFPNRFEKLLKSTKTEGLSFEEITKEVEEVRQKRYDEGRQGR
ncbi:type II toxin-antitoxin system VapB15 family antitoxin [Anaerophaga thermohalophila]|jgi:hypothetical protein|uniref:type II toxin-antitoxin system VapB15 family antitoxin n=1 Tax=Anaerophaga thermohalophila TaxID=177400 RepID=UPI00031CEE1D|nr:hypothetical protein [Anaerophaga thermohalophila]